jgi:hypothetical protein
MHQQGVHKQGKLRHDAVKPDEFVPPSLMEDYQLAIVRDDGGRGRDFFLKDTNYCGTTTTRQLNSFEGHKRIQKTFCVHVNVAVNSQSNLVFSSRLIFHSEV